MNDDRYKAFVCCILSQRYSDRLEHLVLKLNDEGYATNNVWDTAPWEAPKEYLDEMGDDLITKVVTLKQTLFLDEVVALKRFLMEEEKRTLLDNGKRRFNLNPGYLSETGMFLLTHKPNEERDREHIASGVWQEKQYNYDGKFVSTPNTFSEYADEGRLMQFNDFYNA